MNIRTILYSRRSGHIGTALRAQRTALGLTQQQVADRAGCHLTCLKGHEQQKTLAIDVTLVEAFAQALQTTSDALWAEAARHAASQASPRRGPGRPRTEPAA